MEERIYLEIIQKILSWDDCNNAIKVNQIEHAIDHWQKSLSENKEESNEG